MNSTYVKQVLEEQGVSADPVHAAGAAAGVTALLQRTAKSFAKLPLEAEPSHFQAEQRRNAP